ncbi:hypothetical protein F4677DRAFT_451646 [Hypoxylon crocopeplum]|nr:hypothetical protein F4677DRAFT_451646 [Hypoxylon crocopeplum]
MLPTSLVSSYQQYKNDTDSIAAWLASTAKSCGYSSDILPTNPVVKGTARLKDACQTPANPASVRKYIIKVKDFVPLAEFVASNRDVSVPHSLFTTLHRVVAARGGFGGKLAEKGAVTDEVSDAKHGYFVSVLEKVEEALKPRMKPGMTATPPVPSNDSSGADATDDFFNQFAALKVYEPSEDFLNAPDIERPKALESDDVAYEAEPFTSLEDLFIALTMLINDINKIRSRVEWIWTNYRDGLFDLVAAAVATNTAIDLVRNLMEDVVPMFKEHGGLWKVLNKFYFIQASLKGHRPDFPSNGPDDFNYDTYDVANGTYILTCRSLDAFTRVVQPGQVPLYKDGMFGYYDPRSDRASKTGYQKFEEDRVLLMTIFTEFMAVERGVAHYPVEDEFLRGIKELDKTKEVPFYLVFAAQIFLDIHYILREHATRAFATLQENLNFFHDEIDEHFKFHKDLKIDHWPASNDRMVRQMQLKMKWILKDPVYGVKIKAYQQLRQSVPASMEPNRILKMSPVLSGLMLYHFRAEVWDVGIAVANAWGSLTYSLHLYNALQSEKLMSRCWPDMDVVRTLLGESNFFVGDTPRRLVDYFKRFCLQMGTTAAAFTDKRRRNAALASRSGPRGIKDGAPVSCMFMDRYLRSTGQVDWTAEHVSRIVDLGLWEKEGSEDEGTLVLGQINDPEKLKQKLKARERNNSSKIARLPPEQLVKALLFALHGESLEFSFPYLAVHRTCWSLLRAVRKHCDPLLRQTFTAAYMERESELPFVVGYIFCAPVERKDMKLLLAASAAVDEFVRTEGRTAIHLLRGLDIPVVFESEET